MSSARQLCVSLLIEHSSKGESKAKDYSALRKALVMNSAGSNQEPYKTLITECVLGLQEALVAARGRSLQLSFEQRSLLSFLIRACGKEGENLPHLNEIKVEGLLLKNVQP